MAENLKKRPAKGILKSSTSFEKQEQSQLKAASRQKETKWDEMNIMATLHPADKDYGHMKIEEPKTPYNWANEEQEQMDVADGKGVDATALAEKISEATSLPTVCQEPDEESEEEEEETSPEEKEKKKHFESKRKMHYNEFQAVKLARKLMEEDEEEDHEDDDAAASSSAANREPEQEVEEAEEAEEESKPSEGD
ncbi:protein phosphatase inhibitor 2 [Neocloeon triangulifer]|uniref:protein phosphatase inhibitor 2 n=1 Tax=Neocloeon triangulifer TaxID=2078957 RepID=UPI00286F2AD9|nr:protein phosphatase inhibitor 2 [Neocloeon triangulifer]XP_059471812.1 protein phosphatase inhibitor 2 [Neocloeon triangulifer]